MKNTELTSEEYTFLKEAIRKSGNNLSSIVLHKDTAKYSHQQKEDIKFYLLDELVKRGLDKDDEPTELGFFIEDLIDKFKLF